MWASWRNNLGGRLSWLLIPMWLVCCFAAAKIILEILVYLWLQIDTSFAAGNPILMPLVMTALFYVVMLLIMVGAPWVFWKYGTTWREIGVHVWPRWRDIWLGIATIIAYFVVMALIVPLLPIDWQQVQDVGIGRLHGSTQMALGFLLLVILAPITEEIVFRGYLYGKLRARRMPFWAAMLVVSVLFAVAHLQLNVAVSVFVLSIGMCLLREYTGAIWAGLIVHILKNAIAFYLLFVNPLLLPGLGR